jgi:hypothetical protein
MPVRVAAFLVLALACAGAAAQYRWTDADGRVSFGDEPPRDARGVERINAAVALAPPEADALAALPFETRRAARSFPVVLYAPSRECLPCSSARDFLKARAIPYMERRVDTDRDLAAYVALGGNDRLPALGVGRNLLRSFDPAAWGETLANAGYPRDVPLPPGWRQPAPTPLAPPAPAAAPVAPAVAAGASAEAP